MFCDLSIVSGNLCSLELMKTRAFCNIAKNNGRNKTRKAIDDLGWDKINKIHTNLDTKINRMLFTMEIVWYCGGFDFCGAVVISMKLREMVD